MNKLRAAIHILISISIVLTITFLPDVSHAKTIKGHDRNNKGITFNFIDVEIPAVIKFISEITGYNFIFDERIKGRTTIIAPASLTVEESFSLFTSVLSLKGYTVIPTGPKTYKIIPSSLARQAGIMPTDGKMPVNESYIIKLIPTEHIKAEDALQFLRPIVSRDGHISAFGPRNLLLVVDSAVNIEKIMSILKFIDKPSAKEEPTSINVYFLENADATELSKVLQGIIKGLQASFQATQRMKKQRPNLSAPILSITPDKATNSLIIVAPPSDYKAIAEVIKTLDKKRKQVFVEAMIVEASIDKLQDIGTKWRAIARHQGEPIVIAGVGNISSTAVLDIISGLTGFSIGGMGNFLNIPVTTIDSDGSVKIQNLTSPGFAALFSLNQFRDAVNVLSTPQILTSDNEEAEILVGENVPFISQRERDATTTNTVLNSIERTDVGIKLRITPQITEGDYVKLDIFQEISAVKDTSEDILTTVGPTTTKRATKTSVVVKDGHTVVIGGLMQEREEEGVTKTPLLGDIPVLGWLFKFKTVSKNKTNLLVFLSPHVVKDSKDIARITDEKRDQFIKEEKFYIQGELLVRFRDDISHEQALKLIADKGASVIRYFKSINVFHIRLKIKHNVEDSIKEFNAMPEVVYAEPNYKLNLHKVPRTSPGKTGQRPGTMKAPDSDRSRPYEKPHEATKKKTSPDITVTLNKSTYSQGNATSVVHADTPPAANNSPGKTVLNGNYYVQVGAWINPRYADETLARIRPLYPNSFIIKEDRFHKLRIPGIMTREDGRNIIKDIKDNFNENPILVKTTR